MRSVNRIFDTPLKVPANENASEPAQIGCMLLVQAFRGCSDDKLFEPDKTLVDLEQSNVLKCFDGETLPRFH